MNIAIVCVAYNRTDSLKRLLTSLEQAYYATPATLIISIDKSNTDVVEQFADNYHWLHGEKRVARHEQNMGLRAHMLSLGSYFDEFDALIVLEDDITVASSFFSYAQQCVETYYGHGLIAGISLYSFNVNYQNHLPFTPAKSPYHVYFMNCAQSWGEVWMKPQWEDFMAWYKTHDGNFNMEHLPPCLNQWPKSSWLKYHTRYCIEMEKYFVFPYFSLSTNNADPGENFDQTDTLFQANMQATLQTEFRLPTVEECEVCYDGFFQSKFLGKYLGIAEEELCIDLFSDKPQCLFRHYVLSNRSLPYQVRQSFALQLRPIEMNIMLDRAGNELWLYDTTQPATPPKAVDGYQAFAYFYQKAFYKIRTMIGLSRSLVLLRKQIATKLKTLMTMLS